MVKCNKFGSFRGQPTRLNLLQSIKPFLCRNFAFWRYSLLRRCCPRTVKPRVVMGSLFCLYTNCIEMNLYSSHYPISDMAVGSKLMLKRQENGRSVFERIKSRIRLFEICMCECLTDGLRHRWNICWSRSVWIMELGLLMEFAFWNFRSKLMMVAKYPHTKKVLLHSIE